MKFKVQCDRNGCGWNKWTSTAREWHHKPCPECGYPDILSDADMVILESLETLHAAGLVTQEPGDDRTLTIVVDTSALR